MLKPSIDVMATSRGGDASALDMDAGGDDDVISRSWEQGYARPWEELEVDSAGRLKSSQLAAQRKQKREMRSADGATVASASSFSSSSSAASSASAPGELIERGIVRYLYIILDCSVAMDDNDMRPSRRAAAIDALDVFLREFFEQNPISHVGLIVTHNERAEKLTSLSGKQFVSLGCFGISPAVLLPRDLFLVDDRVIFIAYITGNPQQQIEYLKTVRDTGGHISLQKSLDVALTLLRFERSFARSHNSLLLCP
jgi:hypothetical protein